MQNDLFPVLIKNIKDTEKTTLCRFQVGNA